MHIVLKKVQVLRSKKADAVNEIENRLNEWMEKQRYLEEVGEDSAASLACFLFPVATRICLMESVDDLSLRETSKFDSTCEWFGPGWTVVVSPLVHLIRQPWWDDLFFR